MTHCTTGVLITVLLAGCSAPTAKAPLTCTATEAGGSKTISCPDGTSFSVRDGVTGAVGPTGPTPEVLLTDVAPGTECVAGGQRLNLGGREVRVCNGAQGVPGSDGVAGAPGPVGAPGPTGPAGPGNGLTSTGVGDGVTDDTAALNADLGRCAAAGGGAVVLQSGKRYKVTSKVMVPARCGLASDGTGTVYAPAAAFNNTDPAVRYAANAAVIDLSAPNNTVTNVRPFLKGIRLESETKDGRYVNAVVARNVFGLRIEDCEVFGFPVSQGLKVASLSGQSLIARNFIHDFTDNTTGWSYVGSQITAIEVDNDLVAGRVSDGVQIIGNVISNITGGPAYLAQYRWQTDGINLINGKNWVVANNVVSNVGEGVDTFAASGTISGNVFTDCHNFAVKLVHGAHDNVVSGNTIQRAGKSGIVLFGDDAGGPTFNNLVTGNKIAEMNPNGEWPASGAACILTGLTGATFPLRDNLFTNNILNPGPLAGFAISRHSDGVNNVYHGNLMSPGALGFVDVASSETGEISDANPTRLRFWLGADQLVTPGSYQRVNFDTKTFDTRGEFDATAHQWVAQVPGKYRVHATLRFVTLSVNDEVDLAVSKNGALQSQHQFRVAAAANNSVELDNVVDCKEGDTVDVFVQLISAAGPRAVTGNPSTTFVTISAL